MRMRLTIVTFILISVLVLDCKKNTVEPPPPTPSCTYTSRYGVIQHYLLENNTLQKRKRNASVYVTKSCPGYKAPQYVNMGPVYFNSQALKLYFEYWTTSSDTVPQNAPPPYSFQVNGTDEYLSFFESMNDTFPTFVPYTQIPDTMSRSNTTVLQLGFVNANETSVFIETKEDRSSADGSGIWYMGNTSPTTPSITLTYDSNMASASCSLIISCTKSYTKTIHEKPVKFFLQSQYKKKIYFKN